MNPINQRTTKIFILALFLLLIASTCLCAANLTISAIDVGQGDSILVQFPTGQNMLVDAGDSDHGQTVVSYLQSLKISKIDILVASHPHADHIGGVGDVLSAFSIGKVWDSGYDQGSQVQRRFLQTIKEKGIRYGIPKAGFSEKVGTARIDVLAPVRLLSGTESDTNNNSLILRITYGKISFLLMGDAESEERATVSHWAKSTVLKVAHHGSRNGTDIAFLRAVAPKIAVISVAAQNSYGHPHPETMTALKNAKVKVYTTATSGTVAVSTDGNTIHVYSATAVSTVPKASGAGEYIGMQAKLAPSKAPMVLIGNKNSHVFHRPTCSSLPAPKNRIMLSSRDEAIAQGFRPCGRCRP